MAEFTPAPMPSQATPAPAAVPVASATAPVPAGQAPASAATPPAAPEQPKGLTPGEAWAAIKRAGAELNRSQAALRTAQDLLHADQKKLSDMQALAVSDPVTFATQGGKMTVDQLVERIAKGAPVVDEGAKKLGELETRQKALEDAQAKREADATAQSQQKIISDYKATLTTEFEKIADKYPIIAPVAELLSASPVDLLFEIISQHYARTADKKGEHGELMTLDTAAGLAQKHYSQKKAAEKLLAATGIPAPAPDGAKNGGQPQGTTPAAPLKPGSPAASPQAGGPTRAEPSSRPTTLTNALASAPSQDGRPTTHRSRGIQAVNDAIARASARRPS